MKMMSSECMKPHSPSDAELSLAETSAGPCAERGRFCASASVTPSVSHSLSALTTHTGVEVTMRQLSTQTLTSSLFYYHVSLVK